LDLWFTTNFGVTVKIKQLLAEDTKAASKETAVKNAPVLKQEKQDGL
jgi:hypothetical protein